MIVCGHLLNATQKQEIKPYLNNFKLEPFPSPGVLSKNVYFPDLSLQAIADLLPYGQPIQIFCGESNLSLLCDFYDAGIAAVSFANREFSTPIEPQPNKTEFAIVMTHIPNLRSLFRQIFLFAGVNVRADLKTTDELTLVLPELLSGNNSKIHVVIDLDNEIDFLPTLHLLNEYNNDSSIFVWSIRNFEQPGPNPLLLQKALLPFTSRIFTPLEGMLAMIEAFFLYDTSLVRFSSIAGPIQRFDGFYDIERILKGRSINFVDRDPEALWQTLKQLTVHLQNSLPFHWLYSLYRQKQVSAGVVLKSIVL